MYPNLLSSTVYTAILFKILIYVDVFVYILLFSCLFNILLLSVAYILFTCFSVLVATSVAPERPPDLPLSPVLEGFVILRKNPDYEEQ